MAHDLVCWKCGASLAALSLPLRRLEEFEIKGEHKKLSAERKELKALLKGGQAVYVSMDWTDILPKKQQVGGTKEMKEEGKRGAAAAAG